MQLRQNKLTLVFKNYGFQFRNELRMTIHLAEDFVQGVENIDDPSHSGIIHQPIANLTVGRPAGSDPGVGGQGSHLGEGDGGEDLLYICILYTYSTADSYIKDDGLLGK